MQDINILYRQLTNLLLDEFIETHSLIETVEYLLNSGVSADILVDELLFSKEVVDRVVADRMIAQEQLF